MKNEKGLKLQFKKIKDKKYFARYRSKIWRRNTRLLMESIRLVLLFLFGALSVIGFASATAFTFKNECQYTVWPGTLSGNGVAIGGGGFELPPRQSASFTAPEGWSGRFWARTGCTFALGGSSGACITGDCGGALQCSVSGGTPATLTEFTLAGPNSGKDFYDVSLVDGYNVDVGVRPLSQVAWSAGGSNCKYAGCVADVNGQCPAELRVAGSSGETVACRSACEAFGSPEYCCSGAHSSPSTCGPTRYSQLFKSACPAAYSYTYDDATSTFTCAGGAVDYLITFCPSAANNGS